MALDDQMPVSHKNTPLLAVFFDSAALSAVAFLILMPILGYLFPQTLSIEAYLSIYGMITLIVFLLWREEKMRLEQPYGHLSPIERRYQIILDRKMKDPAWRQERLTLIARRMQAGMSEEQAKREDRAFVLAD